VMCSPLHPLHGDDSMKKLRLIVEELTVEQFQVEPRPVAKRGTVRGLEESDNATTGCTQVGCSQACDPSMNANTEPCFYCPREPDTVTCMDTSCC
jgi:hypothetical protein